MNASEHQRLTLIEQKMDILMKEMNTVLGDLTQTVVNIVDTHRLFTVYVESQLTELRGKHGSESSGAERENTEGKEI